jgi:hypothetical protein
VLGPFILHFQSSIPKHRIRKEMENALIRCIPNYTDDNVLKNLLRHIS